MSMPPAAEAQAGAMKRAAAASRAARYAQVVEGEGRQRAGRREEAAEGSEACRRQECRVKRQAVGGVCVSAVQGNSAETLHMPSSSHA